MANNKRMVKIEMVFDDGQVQTLEGEDAENWSRDVDGCVMNALIHGQKMQKHPWRIQELDV